jgi:SnoaL-like domain
VNPVADTLARFVLALDDRDWDGVTACLAETVRRDYSSLFGAEPDEISGPALVAEWRDVLTGLDAHQHLLGPPVVEVDGDRASAAVHVVGTHVLDGDLGSPWVVGGTYRFVLDRLAGRWRIAAATLDTRWQTGDGALLQRGRERSRA